MSNPRVEEIRARVVGSPFSEPSRGDVIHLLTKFDAAEKANPPVEVGSPDGSQVYEIPLTEYLEQMNANQIFRATQAEAKLVAAEERERVLFVGIAQAKDLALTPSTTSGMMTTLQAEVAAILSSTTTTETEN